MYKFHCPDPWFGMCVSFEGNISVNCCHFQFSGIPWDPLNEKLRMAERFNDPFFQRVRAWQSRRTFEGTGCSACENNPAAINPSPPVVPAWLNAKQTGNYKKAVKAWESRELNADYAPPSYIFDFGRACNLNCIMCTQTDVRSRGSRKSLEVDTLMAEEETIALAGHVLFFGGEPLFIKNSRAFLTHMLTRPALEDVGVEMVTNGYYLPDFLHLFESKKRIRLIVSLDATGERYEKVRRGSNWERVSKAVTEFARMKALPGHEHWELMISAVVMKTTLPDLPNLVQFALDCGAETIFYPCHLTRHNSDEALFNNPAILEEMPNWQEILEKTRAMLDSAGQTEQAESMESIIGRLGNPENRTTPNTCEQDYARNLPAFDFEGKRVAIWGTGSYYRLAFKEWLKKNHSKIDFLGFVDNNDLLWGKPLDGFPVMSPDDLLRLSPEVIIVATVYKTQIAQQIHADGFENVEVV